jgi:sodium pump decarboxylase gamma subunit
MDTRPLAERMASGVQTFVLGLGTVFSVLILLWIVLEIFSVVFYKSKLKKTDDTDVESDTAIEAVETIEETYDDVDSGELVVVLTAAIADYQRNAARNASPEEAETKFRVVSFKKIK